MLESLRSQLTIVFVHGDSASSCHGGELEVSVAHFLEADIWSLERFGQLFAQPGSL